MASTYTTNIGIEKPATGDQSGTWGETTNTNFDIIDQGTNGVAVVTLASAGTSGSPNSLPISNGALSDGRNRFIEFNDGGDLGATAYVQLDPNDAEKIVHIRNSLSASRSLILFQGTYNASNDFEIPNGADVLVKFDGGGTGATVTDVNVNLTPTKLTTNTISSTDTNGNLTIDPNGTGNIVLDANVGIGITNPAYKLVVSAGGASGIEFGPAYSGTANLVQHYSRSGASYVDAINEAAQHRFYISGSEKMRLDSSGNVGIGTTSPYSYGKLTIEGGNGTQLVLDNAGEQYTQMYFLNNGTDKGSIWVDNSLSLFSFVARSGMAMNFYANNSEAMRIDTSGSVGIGTASPSEQLHVIGDIIASGYLRVASTQEGGIFDTTGNNGLTVTGSTGSPASTIRAYTGGTERMRIDSSGNLLVGHTAEGTWSSNNSAILRPSGVSTFTSTSTPPLYANRLSTDGTIIDIRKDGSTVGSIGAYNSAIGVISGSAASYTGLYLNTNKIEPAGNNFGSEIRADNTVDIGSSSYRFKDLYLSGIIQLGDGFNLSWGGSYGSGYPTVYATSGSGGSIAFAPNGNTPSTNQVRIVGEGIEFGAASSNLDDYEEGTWTVAFNASVTNPTVTAQGNSFGRYVKIGNIVHFWFYDSGTTITDAGSGFASVGGLPYANEAGYYPVFQYLHGNQFATTTSGGYVSAGTSTCIFIQTDTISTVLWATGTKYMMISGTYKTA